MPRPEWAPEPIVITPQQVTQGAKVHEFQQEIIQDFLSYQKVDIVGVSNAIFLACSAVRVSTAVSKGSVSRSYIDYLDIPIAGNFESIFFTLTTNEVPSQTEHIAAFEVDMRLTTDAQLMMASREVSVGTLTSIALSRLQEFPKLKIQAAGTAMNKAVYIALQITRGGISKEPVAVEAIRLGAIPNDRGKLVSSIEILLRKGIEQEYDAHHAVVVTQAKERISRIR